MLLASGSGDFTCSSATSASHSPAQAGPEAATRTASDMPRTALARQAVRAMANWVGIPVQFRMFAQVQLRMAAESAARAERTSGVTRGKRHMVEALNAPRPCRGRP